MILLVSSNKDAASINIAHQILQNYPFQKTEKTFQDSPVYTANLNQKPVKFIQLNEESVNAQNLPASFPGSKLIVFLSRHSSQSGTPTLTVHAPGNFAEANLGGLPKKLSVAPANAMSDALKTLAYYQQKLSLNFEVSFEVTHHGPSLKVPSIFVELGSSPQQWGDSLAATAVAHAAVAAIEKFDPKPARPAVIGIGGTHYNQKFTQMALDGEAVFSHMIPKYAVENVDSAMLKQCVECTLETVSCAILDWKGIKSEDKPGLVWALDEVKLGYRKI
jgi:D-aminoacyl-tRNA deacylase